MGAGAEVETLIPMVRRIVRARVGSHPASDDLVQETLTRVLAASATIEPGMLEPYAIVTARNVIATCGGTPTASAATSTALST
jgi:serine/threonine-protein kinase RsbT